MEIEEITNKNQWEDFLRNCGRKTFLQSWNWGEFQKSLGNKIWRLGVFDAGALTSVCLVIKHKARRGSFLLAPHGPVVEISNFQYPISNQIQNAKFEIVKVLLIKLEELAKSEKVDFVRISPIWERTEENEKMFKELGFRLRSLHTHPESSWKLDISKTEEELLAGMRKTTRYLVKRAQNNNNIVVFQSKNIEDIEIFNKLHLRVVKEQKFVPFSIEYFQKEFSAFLTDGQIAIFFAKYKGEIIAASYEIFWSEIGFYHHAALLPEYRNIPASYLLQWEAIKEAKKRGCKIYDFWGHIDPVKFPKHPYAGPTLFKMGFGGYADEYLKTQDLVLSPKYWLNYIVETARRIRRGL